MAVADQLCVESFAQPWENPVGEGEALSDRKVDAGKPEAVESGQAVREKAPLSEAVQLVEGACVGDQILVVGLLEETEELAVVACQLVPQYLGFQRANLV